MQVLRRDHDVQRQRDLQFDRYVHVHRAVGRRELSVLERDDVQRSRQRATRWFVLVQRGFHGSRLRDDVPGRELLSDGRRRAGDMPRRELLRRRIEQPQRVPCRALLGPGQFCVHDVSCRNVRGVCRERELYRVRRGHVRNGRGDVVFAMSRGIVPGQHRASVV
jgi:hypothetical protein